MNCKTCKSLKYVHIKMKNRNCSVKGEFIYGTIICPICNGKGYVTDEDRQRIISVEYLEQIV